jgi:1-aminocyclopropane-1-carboxylate synthase
VSFKGKDQFSTDGVSCYELAIKEALESGTRVRAILLCNPHNPLGRCYSVEALTEYMKLCEKYSIHLILDEVYAASVYATERHSSLSDTEESPFKSILAVESKKHINPNYLHLLYGFSKDLAGGGLRLGCIWTRNSALIIALSTLSFFNWPSHISEMIGITMLENEDWMASFRDLSKKRLGERAAFARSILDEYEIPYANSACAGFFLWLDVRKFLFKEGETVTWSQEQELKRAMMKSKVHLTSGETMFSEEPGFFRLCFAKDELEVREGLRRFRTSLTQVQAQND